MQLLELDSRSRTSGTVSEGQVSKGGSMPLIAATGVAILAVVGLLMMVARTGADDAPIEESAQSDSTADPDDNGNGDGDGDGEETADAEAVETVEAEGSSPGEAGLMSMLRDQLLIAAGNGRLVIADPVDDVIEEFLVNGVPVGVNGRELILFRPAEGFVAVDLDDPSSPIRDVVTIEALAAVETETPVARPVTAAIRSDETLLVEYSVSPLGSTSAQSIVYQVDIATGDFTRATLDVGRSSWWFGHGRLGLAWVPDAGLFDGVGDSTVKLSDGFPVLFGADFVITYQCSEPGQCDMGWIDRHTGKNVDRPLPPLQDLWWKSSEVGTGGLMLLVEGSTEPRYFDVARGQWLPDEVNQRQEAVSEVDRFGMRPETVSPDGRLLAIPNGPRVVLHDLETATTGEYLVSGVRRGQRLFFVAG